YHSGLSDGRVETVSEPSFSEENDPTAHESLVYDPAELDHSPTCGNCRFYKCNYALSDEDRFIAPGYCKANPPDNRKKTPWPIVDCVDLCGGHVYDIEEVMRSDACETHPAFTTTLLKCLNPDCLLCGASGLGVAYLRSPSDALRDYHEAEQTVRYL